MISQIVHKYFKLIRLVCPLKSRPNVKSYTITRGLQVHTVHPSERAEVTGAGWGPDHRKRSASKAGLLSPESPLRILCKCCNL